MSQNWLISLVSSCAGALQSRGAPLETRGPSMRLSRKVRARLHYTVEKAGQMEPLRWSRSENYRRARWRHSDRKRRQVLAGAAPAVGRQTQATAGADARGGA